MGSLSNLYISQSYQSLIHLATNNTASATLIDLQDGLGNSIGVSVNTGGNLFLSGSLTASLAKGYTWVGDGNNKTSLVSTSSFGGGSTTDITSLNQFTASQLNINAGYNTFTASNGNTSLNQYTQSNDAKWNTLGGQTGSYVTSVITASSLVTASFSGNTLTFTKGDNSTFGVIIPDVSGSTINTGSFATTGSNTFVGNQIINAQLYVSNSAQYDVVIQGQMIISSSTSGSTNGARLLISGAAAIGSSGNRTSQVLIQPQSVTLSRNGASGPTSVGFTSLGSISTSGPNATITANVNTGSVEATIQTIFQDDPILVYNAMQIATNTNGSYLKDYDNTLADYSPFMFIGANDGASIPIPQFTRGLSVSGSGGLQVTGSTNIESLTASLAQGYTWVGNSSNRTVLVATSSFGGGGSTISVQDEGTILGTATSFNFNGAGVTATLSAGTASVTIPGGGGSIDTGSFATTGSNVFTGIQTFRDAALNATSLVSTSGSLMLVAKSYTSASSHMTGSTGNLVNFIFKDNNNTGDTIISGSNNIIGNPVAPTAEFKRYVSNGNIALFGGLPQISASMAFPVTMNGNFLQTNGNAITARGPVSSSTWTITANFIPGTVTLGPAAGFTTNKLVSGLTFSTNNIPGTVNLVAHQNALTSSVNISTNYINGNVSLNLNSSSVAFVGNIINDNGFTLTNNYYTSSIGQGSSSTNRNLIIGSSNSYTITGIGDAGVAATATPGAQNNIIGGSSNTLFANATSGSVSTQFYNNIIYGNTLIVSASSNNSTTNGGAFFGRYNSNDGRRNSTAGTIFAVGTGTGAGASQRKTGFLIDSGSNTFIEGTLNVSGSTILTGSIISVDNSGNATNTIIGLNALGMGNAGAQPLAIGNTIAVAIGNGAMRFASGSNQNVAIGNNALLITSGSKNFAMGSEALSSNTLGSSNVAIGTSALTKNTTGVSSVAIGDSAGFNTIGSQNTFIGQYSGYNISGSNNTVIGSYQGTAGTLLTNNIILADGQGNVKAQYSGSAWAFQDGINLNRGSNKTSDIVSVNTTATVTNSLVTANSIILVTTQELDGSGNVYPAVVYGKTAGSFTIKHNFGGSLNVAYLIINPTS
jgi:hypothetical protein